MPVFTAAACGGTIDVPVSTPFAIDLEENPTTGYRWEFEVDAGLEIISSDFTQNQGGGAGAAGVRQLVARADQQGEFLIHGKLLRSWIGDSSTTTRCDITVRAS
jgi:inhibitor of cysteine peptidase